MQFIHSFSTPSIKFSLVCIFAAGLILSGCAGYQMSGSSGSSVSIDGEVLPDTTIQQFINPYKARLEEEMGQVIGMSARELGKPGRGENPLGNLVADFQKEFVAEVWGIEADISVINNGGLRTLLPKGAITLGKVYEISPFENYLYILELSPEDVKTLAHYTVHRQNLSISGMHLKSSDNQLEELLINGKPLDTNKTYLLAINDYLANGGDDMPFLIPVRRYRTSTTLIRDVIITKIKELEAAGKMVDARLEGRQLLN